MEAATGMTLTVVYLVNLFLTMVALVVLVVLVVLAVLAAVGGGGSSGGSSDGSTPPDIITTCEHDFSTVGYDDYIHWKQCSKCGEKQTNSEETHTLGNATDDGENTGTHSFTCTLEGCEYKKTEAHTFGEDGNCTATGCTATNSSQVDCEHDFSQIGSDDTNHWKKCSKCGAIEENSTASHTLGDYEDNFDGTHVAKCTFEGCEYRSTKKHEYGEDGNCTVCNAKACYSGEHNYTVTQWNEQFHWLKCTWCDNIKSDSREGHSFGVWTPVDDGTDDGAEISQCTFENCGCTKVRYPDTLLGDLNEDKLVNITDLIILKRHVIAGSKTEWILTGNKLSLADLNNDDSVDITDIIILKRKILESLQS